MPSQDTYFPDKLLTFLAYKIEMQIYGYSQPNALNTFDKATSSILRYLYLIPGHKGFPQSNEAHLMKHTLIFLFICLLTSTGALFAQTEKLPDRIDAQLEKAENILFSQPDQAFSLANSALVLSQQQAYKPGQAKANKILARIFASRGDYTSALQANQTALSLFQDLDMTWEVCRQYISLGVIYRYLKLYDESISYNIRAEQLAHKHAYTDLKAAIYGNRGNVYFDKHDYDQALKFHIQSLQIDKALKNEQGIGNTYHNIGMIYRTNKKFDQALVYTQKSLAIDIKRNNFQSMGLSYIELTEMYMEMGNFQKALQSATKALQIAQSIHSKSLQQKVLLAMPVIHAALGNPTIALSYQEQYKQLTDSLQSAILTEQISQMQARYQAAEKDKELSLQSLHLQAQQTSLTQQRLLIVGLLIFLLTACVIAFLLFNRYKLQQKLKLTLENEQYQLSQNLQMRQNIDQTIHYFATSLYGKNTVDEILWDVAKNCIARLGFVDCVIYLLDEQQQLLIQKAAFGAKNPQDYTILEPLLIPVGQGIVGSVAKTGKAELVADTTIDARYLMDDQMRYSELAVPLLLGNKVIGVIDSEHPEKGYFKQHHLEALQTIAAVCSSKIARAQADEEAKKAKLMQLEADHLKKLDAIKSQFFANISHEFRTPLHLILAPLQKKEEISVQEINMMKGNAHRLLRLVNQLLDLAKAEVGMLELNLREGNILAFLHHAACSFQALAENKSLHYLIDIPDQELLVPFDPDILEKIVYNLLSNAIKFTPTGGEVTIQASIETDDMLKIVIADSGLGVPVYLQSKIFDRFYQVDGSQTRSFEGTGIGLALTKELVDLYGGSICLNSTEGKGSSFLVKLPLKNEKIQHPILPYISQTSSGPQPIADLQIDNAEAMSVAQKDDENQAKPTILLVEDHTELRNYLKQQLMENFQVLLAKQGDEGLSIAIQMIPDLIITDIMMPVMDGVALTRHLKDNPLTSHIPIIMLTAKEDGESKMEGFSTGAEQYLVKPFIFGELLARINSLLTQRNRLRIKYSREVILQPTATTIPDREAAFLEQTIRIIDEHISDENFTVEVLQKKIGMSRMQLHRKLTALTGQSASELIRTIRLKRAADLLQQPGIQIAEAAYMSGFSHMSYFSKSFKEQFGVLPSAYVKQSN
jgi:signal transduction histidine kinase/DNA-binding response OmpR family regulator